MNATHSLGILWRVLTASQRRRFAALQFVAVLMAMSTVAGLAAVMTFLAALADPGFMETHAALAGLRKLLDTTSQGFLAWLGGGFIVLLLLSAIANVLGSLAMGRFAFAVADRVREVLFREYLRRNYLFHVRTGAARLMDNVLYQSDRVTITLFNGQLLITNAVLTLLVVASIAAVNLTVALIGVLTIGGSYFVLYYLMRRRLSRNGSVQTQLGAERLAVVQQALLGIKYLLLAGAQPSFTRRLDAITRSLSQSQSETQFIGQFPKYVLEGVAGATLIVCAAVLSRGSSGEVWLAQLSFIGFAGFRLLPAIQQMYHAFVVVRANQPAIENLARQIERAEPAAPSAQRQVRGTRFQPHAIELSEVSFRYSADEPRVLHDVTLRVLHGAAIGIVGESGSGKTTLVDLILGLLAPTGGNLEVEGSIGYVPQDTMIWDASVRENIALGCEPRDIDDLRVREAAHLAGCSEFIDVLPGGYAASISSINGGLSGGQRQRIGIARALYRAPTLLVLDEATSSLDAATERAIIDTVIRNRGARTLVIVTHGAAVIDACDEVFELRDGKLHDHGARRVTRLKKLAE